MSEIKLPTPSINNIKPFDPSVETRIEFTYVGNQIYANRLVIMNATNSSVIYDKTETDNMSLFHTLLANAIDLDAQDGNLFWFQVQVFDDEGNSSPLSEILPAYCYTTPTFELSGVDDGEIIKNANVELNLSYSQDEGEELEWVQYLKCDENEQVLSQSNKIYVSSVEDWNKYTFHELDIGAYYFIAIGETNHGIGLESKVKITVDYRIVGDGGILHVENNKYKGYIEIRTNIKDAGYDIADKNEPNCILKDGVLILNNNFLEYNTGFEVDNDFVLLLEAKDIPLHKFLIVKNISEGKEDEVFYLEMISICDKKYCQLVVKDTNIVQCLMLPENNDTYLIFEVKRANGVYGLDIYDKADKLKE